MKLVKKIILFWLLIGVHLNIFSQTTLVKQVKLINFKLQSSELISEKGSEISQLAYSSNVYWFPVKVPSTVLTGLVANKVYPDPYQGMNNMFIPDASDSFNKMYGLSKYSHLFNTDNPWRNPYWYRTSFIVSANDKGRDFHLVFKGINYRAAVWLNGKQIADSTQMVGMFKEYKFNVSEYINFRGENVLAVKIYPLDYAGLPDKEQLKCFDDFYLNGGPTGDIGKNVTMLCSVGWDWVPPVRDRNMGIWQAVYLQTSGVITIEKPHIITTLPHLPDTSLAKISLSFFLNNNSEITQKGKLKISIKPENFQSPQVIEFSKEVSLQKGKSLFAFDAENTIQFLIKDPKLWWANGYGEPNLYRIKITYESNKMISDEVSFNFGIRTISTQATEVPDKYLRRDFYLNGKRIHLVGGAWVPDMMLNRDFARYHNELRLCRNANINLVRIWGGGITPPDVFFDMADKYGLLIWSDFWVTGDTQGEFKGSQDWPLEGQVFIENMISTILRIRNHPSLLVWTGGNEGHIRKELYDAMRAYIISLDGTRPYIPCSSGLTKLPKGFEGAWPDNKHSGVYSGGPYSWKDEKEYFRLAKEAKDWVFKDETGIPSHPPYNSLPKIIPNLVWDKKVPFPMNDHWGYHDAATGNGRYDLYYYETLKRYGEANSMKDYCNKTQLMNATGYRGIFEATAHKLNDNGGVMLWKLNAAFPSVIWQVYDWYLNPNAGYYFMQNACQPIHILLDALTHNIITVNRSLHAEKNLKAEVVIYDFNSTLLFQKTENIKNIEASEVKALFSINKILNQHQGIKFVVLNIKNKKEKNISHNVYWLNEDDNYQNLSTIPKSKINIDIVSSTTDHTKGETIIDINFKNTSNNIAFFINPQLIIDNEEIMPSLWTTNYFSLAPNESINAKVNILNSQIKSKPENLKIKVEGWNIETQIK